MKKLVLCFAMALIASTMFSQEIVVQSSTYIPEQGDFSVGVDLVPVMMVVFGTEDMSDTYPSIVFKGMLTDNVALRSEVMINYTSLDSEYTDKFSESSYGAAVGPEWRAGTGRVQGFFGFMAGFVSTKSIYEQENENTYGELKSFGGVLKGFLGAEYFIAPKFAIGSQITWGPAYVKTTDVDSDVQVTVFDISTNNIQGALMLSYYF